MNRRPVENSESADEKLARVLVEIERNGEPDYPDWKRGGMLLMIFSLVGGVVGLGVGSAAGWRAGGAGFFLFAGMGLIGGAIAAFRPPQ